MANSLTSNITRKVMRQFLIDMESQRVLSKTVNTQLFSGKFSPQSGASIDVKRPHRYKAYQSSDGDISGGGADNDIISGKATATVQPYITIKIPFTNYEEALEADQLEDITAPAAEELVSTLETTFGQYMHINAGLSWGDPDQAVDAWSHIAGPMALMKSIGVPKGNQYYAMNPYVAANLADAQNSLNTVNNLVKTAWEEAQISKKFAGLRALSTDSLVNRTSSTMADRAGALSGTPTATYLSTKDTMTQTLAVTGFTANSTLLAGEVLEITGRYFIHQRTRQTFLDETGNAVKYRCVVTANVLLDGSGAGNVVVAGAPIYESGGQYNNVDSALTAGDVVNVLGSSATLYQPSMFYHRDAFSIAFVKIPKLFSTDTLAITKDGLMIRVSKYADGDANKQSIRLDMLPAFATLNPFFAGQGFGKA